MSDIAYIRKTAIQNAIFSPLLFQAFFFFTFLSGPEISSTPQLDQSYFFFFPP